MSGEFAVDYLEIHTQTDLTPVKVITEPSVLLVAARLGNTRLLDNIELG